MEILRQAVVRLGEDGGESLLVDFWTLEDGQVLVNVARSQGLSRWGPSVRAEPDPWGGEPPVWVATFEDGSQVMVELWSDGTVKVAERPDSYSSWGPPSYSVLV